MNRPGPGHPAQRRPTWISELPDDMEPGRGERVQTDDQNPSHFVRGFLVAAAISLAVWAAIASFAVLLWTW
jgi:hypothetical protein